jgi:hypothetical protein
VVRQDGVDEIDVTRVQMLFFTVVTALFVALKILATFTIPEIPPGFLLLMGISNGIYLSNKFIPNQPDRPEPQSRPAAPNGAAGVFVAGPSRPLQGREPQPERPGCAAG